LFGHDFQFSSMGSKNTLTNFKYQKEIGFEDNHVRWLKCLLHNSMVKNASFFLNFVPMFGFLLLAHSKLIIH
jgi:hypothetical protein